MKECWSQSHVYVKLVIFHSSLAVAFLLLCVNNRDYQSFFLLKISSDLYLYLRYVVQIKENSIH